MSQDDLDFLAEASVVSTQATLHHQVYSIIVNFVVQQLYIITHLRSTAHDHLLRLIR